MARLVSAGFENNTHTAGIDVSTANSSNSGPYYEYRGARGFELTVLANSGVVCGQQYQWTTGGGGNGPYYARVYAAWQGNGISTAECAFMGFYDSTAAAYRAYITMDSSGVVRLRNQAGTLIGSITLPNNVFYDPYVNFELKIDRSPSAGSQIIEARVDGTVFATSSTQTITTSAGDTLRVGLNLLSEANTGGQVAFDDIAVNDGTGSFQNSYPGEGRIVHLRPVAAGDLQQCAIIGGAPTHWAAVNEITPDDGTWRLDTGTTSGITDFFLVDPVPPNLHPTSQINLVSIGVRFSDWNVPDTTSAIQVLCKKITNGTISNSSSLLPNSTTWYTNTVGTTQMFPYPLNLYQDPDSINWTKDTLESMQIGVKCSASGGATGVYVTQLWALVEYVPVYPGSFTNKGKTLTVGNGMSRNETAF